MGAHLGPRPSGNIAYISGDPFFNAVSLLLHGDGTNGAQNNTFLDSSTNNATVTRYGNTTQGSFSPFAPTTAYSTSVNGGSIQFNGSTDYLTLSNTPFSFGTNSFTVDFWYYYVAGNSTYNTIFDNGLQGVFLSFDTSTKLLFFSSVAQTNPTGFAHGMTVNTWNHIAFVRDGTVATIYVNGVSIGSRTGITGSMSPAGGSTAFIGQYSGGGSYYLNGSISNFRVINGTALYTATFTPPTAPVTAISGTSLLLNGTNAGIFDNAAKNNLQTVGNAQISTSVKKYGTGSMSFDGTGDWLSVPSTTQFDFTNDNFTIEFWLNPTSWYGSVVSKDASFIIYRNNSISTTKMGVRFNNNAGLDFFSTDDVPVGSWSYWALVRNGNVFTWYLNGVSSGSFTSSATVATNTNPVIVGHSTTFNISLTGYIDDLRITKGVARYTANFTPPTAALLDQ